VPVLPHHHDFFLRGNRDDVYPSGCRQDVEVALATMRMGRLTPMKIEDRCAVDSFRYERFPTARFHLQTQLRRAADIRWRDIDPSRQSSQPCEHGRPLRY